MRKYELFVEEWGLVQQLGDVLQGKFLAHFPIPFTRNFPLEKKVFKTYPFKSLFSRATQMPTIIPAMDDKQIVHPCLLQAQNLMSLPCFGLHSHLARPCSTNTCLDSITLKSPNSMSQSIPPHHCQNYHPDEQSLHLATQLLLTARPIGITNGSPL